MSEEAEEIFADVLEVEVSHRAAFLAFACKGNPGLRTDVEAMLRDAKKADTLFASLTGGAPGAPNSGQPSPPDRAGSQLGPYHLVQLLGRGGFGSVWMAEQKEPIRRLVALKLIRRGMDSEEVLARFRSEQQALALMDHPNIARVFDAGTAPDGRPFFVMEMVQGEKITEFCDRGHLTLPERLRLFLQVCAAVNHAHQKGIIHRDLKPSNILVSSDGGTPEAKVIDFGIAKAVDGDIAINVTREDQFVGTPTYMSPEQADRDRSAIDTRTDVYSLGVILYELLVGTPPFDEKTLAAAGREEIYRIIREEEPSRPSTKLLGLPEEEITSVAATRRVPKDVLPRMVGAELDWIAMKAIEKSKDRRYGTADALAKDVLRFLNSEPVSARPPSTGYLLSKFVRRHRLLLGTLTAIAVILVTATATSLWLAIRAQKAEQLADTRLAQVVEEKEGRETALRDAEAVSSFIVDIFRRPDPNRDGRTVAAADVLAAAEKEVRKKLADQPVRQLLMKRTLAETYTGLGLYLDALRLRRETLKEVTTLFGEKDPTTLDDCAQLSNLLLQLGYYDEALSLLEREAELRKTQANSEKLHSAESSLINCLLRTGQHKRAEEKMKTRQETPTGSREPSSIPDGKAGAILREEKVEGIKKRLSEISTTSTDDPLLMELDMAAKHLFGLGDRPAAVAVQRDLTNRLNQKYGPDHMFTITAENDLAFLLMKSGMYAESHEIRRSLLARRHRIFGPEHLETLIEENNFAQVQFFAGNLEEATKALERVVPLLDKVAGRDDRAALNAQSNLGRCYAAGERTPEAIELLIRCSPKMQDDSFIAGLLARLLIWTGRNKEYREYRKGCLDWAWERRNQMGSRSDISERLMLLSCLEPLENTDQKKMIREMLRLCEEQRSIHPNPKERESGWQQTTYGAIHYRLGDFDSARRCLEKARDFYRETPNSTWRQTADIFLAMTLANLGVSSAADFYEQAREAIPDPPSVEHPLKGCSAIEGEPLVPWILRREADSLFQQ